MADPREPKRAPLWVLFPMGFLAAFATAELGARLGFPGWGDVLAFVVVVFWSLALRRNIRLQFERMRAIAAAMPAFPAELQPYHSELEPVLAALQSASRRITAFQKEEQKGRAELESVLDSMQNAVVAVDAAGRIQWSNAPLQQLVYGSPGLAIRTGQALVHTIRDPEVLGCVAVALEQKQNSVTRSTTVVPGRIFEVNASPMPGGGAVAVLHDVTRMEELERTQRDFVANVSHELRTPLTSITGYVETLVDHEQLSEQAREFLGTILKNAVRMTRLTEDLLVMARVEAPRVELRPAPVASGELVRDAVDAVSGIALENAAELVLEELTEAEVLADPDAVLQVLGNLVVNAIKYGKSRTGGARVVLRAQELADAVQFSVQDFGSGIASEHLARIFERFYRVDKARSRDSGGTGLGLSIARHIVQVQGGAIWAESSLGQGSTFFFTLPKAPFPRPRSD